MAKTKARTKVVTGIEALSSDEVRQEIKRLFREVQASRYALYKLMYKAYTEELFKEWGYDSFSSYARSEIEVEYRVAMFYVQMGKAIEKYNVPKEKVESLSWTKFKEISNLMLDDSVDKKTIDTLLDKAQSMTYSEIKDIVRETRVKSNGEEVEKRHRLSLLLYKDQYDLIIDALKLVKERAGIEDVAIGLEFIVKEWLMLSKAQPIPSIIKDIQKEREVAKAKHKKHAQADKKKAKKKKKE